MRTQESPGVRNLVLAAAATVLTAACASNPATGGHNVVLTTVKGEQEQARRVHQEIIQFYGLYEDQSVQDYVQRIGAKVAAQTPIARLGTMSRGIRHARRRAAC